MFACLSTRLVARRRRLPLEAVYSHRTAAWLHGLDQPACDPIQVTLPQSSVISHLSGVCVMKSNLTDGDVCDVRGLPATSRTRTVADLVRGSEVVDGVVMLDLALRQQIVTLEDLHAWIRSHTRHRGVGRLTRAMDLADARSESPMETRLRMLLVLSGLPRPEVQASLRGAGARPDLYYPEHRLVIEYDGAAHRSSLAADNRRQNRLVDSGYRELRFTAGDILNTPASVTGVVRRALGYSIGSPN